MELKEALEEALMTWAFDKKSDELFESFSMWFTMLALAKLKKDNLAAGLLMELSLKDRERQKLICRALRLLQKEMSGKKSKTL